MTLHDPLTTIETQECLVLAGYPVSIDGAGGPQTDFALACYNARDGLVIPLGNTLLKLTEDGAMRTRAPASAPLSAHVLSLARSYLAAGAREVGGNNRGPWVRYFLHDDAPGAWCAGFAVLTCLAEAEKEANRLRGACGLPLYAVAAGLASAWCPAVHDHAKARGMLVSDLAAVQPGWLVLFPDGAGSWHHVGIVEATDVGSGTCLTLEGNAPDESDRGLSDRVARHFRKAATGLCFVNVDMGATP